MLINRRLKRTATWLGLSIPLAFVTTAIAGQQSNTAFEEPPTFASKGGKLNLMVIAKEVPNPYVSDQVNTTAWVYETCEMDPATSAWNARSCAGVPGTVARNGGPRLALQPGDLLKIRFVNKLPLATDFANAKHDPTLNYNPTNLHVHGMLVEPRVPTPQRKSYGDTIYVLAFPSANVASNQGQYFQPPTNPLPPAPNNIKVPFAPSVGPHQYVDILPDVIDYEFNVPGNHPSGTFILHPHPHGPTANQMQAGLSSLIEVGSTQDRMCDDWLCNKPLPPTVPVRHMVLDDTQIGPNGELLTEINPSFCSQSGGSPTNSNTNNNGYCVGDPDSSGKRGTWFFAVSSQIYPKVNVTSPDGEIWSLSSHAGSATYQVSLQDDSGKPMAVQIISVDGISINTADFTELPNDVVRLGGSRFHLANCPADAKVSQKVVCADSITMMPSARAEIWVTHRDVNGKVTSATGTRATLKTSFWNTGYAPYGDQWPAINLVDVTFNQPQTTRSAINVKSNPLFGPNGALTTPFTPQYQVPTFNNACVPLAPNHYRRIYFGAPANAPNDVGLGWEIMEYEPKTGKSTPVKDTRHEVAKFDLNTDPVCVQLGKGNHPVAEVWEIVNLAPETHNFHIHQNKFRVVDITVRNPVSPYFTHALKNREVFGQFQTTSMDNIALPPAPGSNTPGNLAQGGCTIDQVHAGTCAVTPVQLEMPFKFAGDIVYHCHILSHEDAGMMAKLHVATNSGGSYVADRN